MKKLTLCLAALVTVALFAGCNSNAPLKETVWTPVKLENQGDIGLVQEHPVWFFINADSSVIGNTGVNQLVSKANIAEDGKLAFDPPLVTRMAGANLAYESIFVKMMEQTRNYMIQKQTLKVFDKDGDLLGTFTVGPETLKTNAK